MVTLGLTEVHNHWALDREDSKGDTEMSSWGLRTLLEEFLKPRADKIVPTPAPDTERLGL